MKEMLCDIKRSTESVGLGIHPDKILSNQEKVKEREVTIDHIKIEVLQKKTTVRGTLDKKSRSRSTKQQKSRTD